MLKKGKNDSETRQTVVNPKLLNFNLRKVTGIPCYAPTFSSRATSAVGDCISSVLSGAISLTHFAGSFAGRNSRSCDSGLAFKDRGLIRLSFISNFFIVN